MCPDERVSTTDQNPDSQEDALQKVGCEKIFRAIASGAVDSLKGLSEAIEYARDGDTLVVWKLDRIGAIRNADSSRMATPPFAAWLGTLSVQNGLESKVG